MSATAERVEAQLALISRLDARLNAFALTTPELAREAVWRLERDGTRGPLAGRTLAVKDLFDVAGLPTAGGGRVPPVEEARGDATAVARLRAVGMVPLGKANTVQFAFGTWGVNRATATPRNPWDAQVVRVPGGSSSGSAVAVASGLADMALGTDTGGSVRIPCALNGLTGIKPSFGQVSRARCLPLSPTLDTVGPMAWTVAEAAQMLAALAGADPADPATADAQTFDATAALTCHLKGKRLAVLGDAALGGVSDAVGAAYLTALSVLEKLGARLVEARMPMELPACAEPNGLVLRGEAWRLWGRYAERYGGEMDPGALGRINAGATVGDVELARALAARAVDQRRFHAWLQEHAALLTPTVPIAAPPLDSVDEGALPFSPFTRAANWLDLPAVALPCGSERGLPLSLQVLGVPGDDAGVVGVAQAYQQATDWHERRPDVEALAQAR